MDPAVSSRNAGLVCGILEGFPSQSHRLRGCVARFYLRGSWQKRNRTSEGITPCEKLQDFGGRRTEGAMPRTAFRKRWRRKGAWLVGYPVPAVDGYSALKGTAPSLNLLPLEKKGNCGNRTYGVKS